MVLPLHPEWPQFPLPTERAVGVGTVATRTIESLYRRYLTNFILVKAVWEIFNQCLLWKVYDRGSEVTPPGL